MATEQGSQGSVDIKDSDSTGLETIANVTAIDSNLTAEKKTRIRDILGDGSDFELGLDLALQSDINIVNKIVANQMTTLGELGAEHPDGRRAAGVSWGGQTERRCRWDWRCCSCVGNGRRRLLVVLLILIGEDIHYNTATTRTWNRIGGERRDWEWLLRRSIVIRVIMELLVLLKVCKEVMGMGMKLLRRRIRREVVRRRRRMVRMMIRTRRRWIRGRRRQIRRR
jgi:hypothetical protein